MITVNEEAIRQLVRETFEGQHIVGTQDTGDSSIVNVNSTVDPSAALTDELNTNFVPQNKVELDMAVKRITQDLSNDKVPSVYRMLTKAIASMETKDKKDFSMKMSPTNSKKNVEEAIRREVRKVLSEISPKNDMSYSGVDYGDEPDENDEVDPLDSYTEPAANRAFKTTALGNMSDVGGASFDEIAQETGFSVAGAKQAVDKALRKLRFLSKMDHKDYSKLVLKAMGDYVEMLNSSGELSSADVQLMKSHPDVVQDLDGFREFLHGYVRKARNAAGDHELTAPEAPMSSDLPTPRSKAQAEPVKLSAEDELDAGWDDAPAAKQAAAVATKKAKEAYKIYGRNGKFPVHTRIKGKVYGGTKDSKFKTNDQASVVLDPDGTLKVTDPKTGHTQDWLPESFGKPLSKKVIKEISSEALEAAGVTLFENVGYAYSGGQLFAIAGSKPIARYNTQTKTWIVAK